MLKVSCWYKLELYQCISKTQKRALSRMHPNLGFCEGFPCPKNTQARPCHERVPWWCDQGALESGIYTLYSVRREVKQIGFDSMSDGSEAELHPHPSFGSDSKKSGAHCYRCDLSRHWRPTGEGERCSPCGLQHAFIDRGDTGGELWTPNQLQWSMAWS